MQITNKMNLPEALVKAVSPEKHNKPNCLSATTLIKGTKETILTDRHWNEITVDVSQMIWALFGTAVHLLLEQQEGDNVLKEVQFEKEFQGITVTGKVDNYDLTTQTLNDYKTASTWKARFKSFEDWEKQGYIYAYLMKQSGYTVKKARFIALLKDWTPMEAKFGAKKGYPALPVYVHEFDIDPLKLLETERFIKDRVADYLLYRNLPDDSIPDCTEHERWEEKPSWAVMKKGKTKASKVFKAVEGFTEADAKNYAAAQKDSYIEFRPGEVKKCENYCNCNGFCSFWKERQAAVNNFLKEGESNDGESERQIAI